MGKLRKLSGRRILRGFGYFFFFLVMTFVFTYLTLPFEQIKARYVKVAEDKYGVDIIGKIDKSWFTGLAVKNLRITPRGKPGEKVEEMEIEEGGVRLSLLPLFLGRLQVTAAAKLGGGGAIDAKYTRRGGNNDVDLRLDKVDFKSVPILKKAMAGKAVDGVASGRAEITLAKNVAESSGKVSLDVEGVKLGQFQIPIAQWGNQPFTIPALNLGNLKAELELQDGAAVVKTFKLEGSADIQASAEGYLLLRDPLPTSQLRIYLKFKFSDTFFKSNPKFTILQGEATLKSAQRPDGYYGFLLEGMLGQLQFMQKTPMPNPPPNMTPPKGGAAAAPAPGGPGRPPGAPPPPPGGFKVPEDIKKRLGGK